MAGDVRLVAVDPGIRGCGVALFDGDELLWASLVKNPHAAGNGLLEIVDLATAVRVAAITRTSGPWRVVGEWPQVYRGSKANPNALVGLAGIVGAVAGGFSLYGVDSFATYLPREWKGPVSKADTREMAEGVLSATEVGRVEDDHNAWDAVGIGLHDLGRLSPLASGPARSRAPSRRRRSVPR